MNQESSILQFLPLNECPYYATFHHTQLLHTSIWYRSLAVKNMSRYGTNCILIFLFWFQKQPDNQSALSWLAQTQELKIIWFYTHSRNTLCSSKFAQNLTRAHPQTVCYSKAEHLTMQDHTRILALSTGSHWATASPRMTKWRRRRRRRRDATHSNWIIRELYIDIYLYRIFDLLQS